MKSPIWWPKTLPPGYKIDTLDIVELDKGTGLVCNAVFLNGNKAIVFTEGSPKQRNYPIVSARKVPWGTEKADVMHQDPTDPTSPVIIIYNRGGNFAELQGDPTTAQLETLAKSMVLVK